MRFTVLIAAVSLMSISGCSKKKDDKKSVEGAKTHSTTTTPPGAKNKRPIAAPTHRAGPLTKTSKKKDTRAPDEGYADKALTKVGSHTEDMCKCTDYACAQSVMLEFARAMKDVQKARSGPMPTAKRKLFIEGYNKFRDCHNKVAPKDRHLLAKQLIGDPRAGQMGEFARSMCKCKTLDCGKKVYGEVKTWSKENLKGGKAEGTPQEVADFNAAQKKLVQCYMLVLKPGSGPKGMQIKPPKKTAAPKK